MRKNVAGFLILLFVMTAALTGCTKSGGVELLPQVFAH